MEKRAKKVAELLSISLSNPDPNFELMEANCQTQNHEEKLFYIFMVTHFDSSKSAKDFYDKINWNYLIQSDTAEVLKICKEFFTEKGFIIGDHRRYFRCMKRGKKEEYTTEILESYKNTINKYGSQSQFFEIDSNPEFDTLYQRMKKEIAHFHTRLPRFDHLERVSRTHNFYTIPKRFYAEDATGPLDGLTYLFFGKPYRKDRNAISEYLRKNFPDEWNPKVEENYQISPEASPEEVIQTLEQWTIDHVKDSPPLSQRSNPAYIFDLESCLCNWQKRK